MLRIFSAIALRLLLATMLALGVFTPPSAKAAPPKGKPRWEEIAKVIDAYFAKVPQHQPHGIITQTEVEPLWEKLAKAKWAVLQSDRDEIMKLIPTTKEFLVKELQTPHGYKFMRTVATKYPEIYDRLDKLSHTDGGGKPGVSGLIAAPDAELTVKYMFSDGGKTSWAAMLPERYSFNKPTGRIYTAEELKTRLEELFEGSK